MVRIFLIRNHIIINSFFTNFNKIPYLIDKLSRINFKLIVLFVNNKDDKTKPDNKKDNL